MNLSETLETSHLDLAEGALFARYHRRPFNTGFLRICPGRFLADASLFMTIALTLSVFDIKKAVDSNGKVIEPEFAFTSGTIRQVYKICDASDKRSD